MVDLAGPARDPFHWILGPWRIQRTIADHAAMSGAAEIALLSDTEALYQERVAVALVSGKSLTGSCRYLHRCTDGGFDILFADTLRLFHSLQFHRLGSDLVANATHACGLDLYRSQYILAADGGIAVRHTVCGPRKNYVSNTEYRRP